MIPFRAKPNVKRDELAKAQNVAGLPWYLSKSVEPATKRLEEAKGLLKERANPQQIYEQTAKTAPAGETGFYQNPGQQWMFRTSDSKNRILGEPLAEMKSSLTQDWNGEWTDRMNLDRVLGSDSLYDYEPRLREVNTRTLQPDSPAIQAEGGYGDPIDDQAAKGTPYGKIEAIGRYGVDPNAIDQPMSILGLANHEKEHALQYMHQLPRGGNKNDTFMQAFFDAQMKPQANKVRVQLQTMREQFAKDYAIKLGQGPTIEALDAGRAAWASNNPVEAELLDQSVRVGGEPGQFGGQGRPKVAKKPGYSSDWFGQYTSLSGEQAATGVQADMGRTIEELRQQVPTAFGGDRLHPALQMNRWGRNNFTLPDMEWALANSTLRK